MRAIERISRVVAVALVSAVLLAPSVQAHHSFSAYNRAEAAKRTIRGTVTEFALINPHGRLKLSVPGPGGKPAVWSFELSSATQLATQGWRPDSVRVGARVDVTYFPLRFGSYGGLLLSVRLPDGRTLQGTAEPDRGYPKPGKH